MKFLLFLPFIFQGLAMTVDEFHFHRKRGLPLWERIGHPLDTLTVLVCFMWLMARPLQVTSVATFVGLAGFSCLWVTKDEWVHHRYCSVRESWLHAVLFILHPVCFMSAGWMAWIGGYDWFIKGQIRVLVLFIVYQCIYWNLFWRPKNEAASSSGE